jgi:hypothetical protein
MVPLIVIRLFFKNKGSFCNDWDNLVWETITEDKQSRKTEKRKRFFIYIPIIVKIKVQYPGHFLRI